MQGKETKYNTKLFTKITSEYCNNFMIPFVSHFQVQYPPIILLLKASIGIVKYFTHIPSMALHMNSNGTR